MTTHKDMTNHEDLFQEKLEALEAGHAFADVAHDLGTDETELLQLASSLRELPYPAQTETAVTDQRAALLALASQEIAPPTEPTTLTGVALLMSQLRQKLAQFFENPQVAGTAALAIVAAVLIFGWFGIVRLSTQDANKAVAQATLDKSSGIIVETPAAEGVVEQVETSSETAEVEEAEEAPVAEETAVAAVPNDLPFSTFLPNINTGVQRSAQTAVLDDVSGIVEVQYEEGGNWTAVTHVTALKQGSRVRTGAFSNATITFFDDSQALLTAESELSLDTVDAQKPEDGFRDVVMTQWAGESEHHVFHRGDGGSRYEVNTPSGSGIARGTKFKVIVNLNLITQFIVTEGKVDVTHLNQTVGVTAGQLTNLLPGNPPTPPYFTVTGEGEVSQTGTTWLIAGQSFQTDASTLIIGNPQVGDIVKVEGHLIADGSQVADRVWLLQRNPGNQFTLTGEAETIGNDSWTIAGQSITINNNTTINADIEIGDTVEVSGVIGSDGEFMATLIRFLNPQTHLQFQFSGVVEEVGATNWVVSGQTIEIHEGTNINGDIAVGDVVRVNGRIVDNNWRANRIRLLNNGQPTFSFTGSVQSTTNWLVAGIPFETRSWTIIGPAITIGDLVRAQGRILPDGTWVATAIQLLTPVDSQLITIAGIVTSKNNPWIVNGVTLVTDGNTIIGTPIPMGSLVKATVQLRPDGSWITVAIQPLFTDFGLGCFTISGAVTSFTGSQLSLKNGRVVQVGNNINITGNIKADSIITLPVCYLWDGSIIIIGDIVVIYQPIIIIINNGGGGGNGIPPGCRVTPKGKVKCSGGGSSRKSKKSS